MTGSSRIPLVDGARVAVVGGGPAGSFFAFFLRQMGQRVGREFRVDLYEPRDFTLCGPRGCNMCGGIISESLMQSLATEGIQLPTRVIHRRIDSYFLHVDVGSVRIPTPVQEMRIAAVARCAGPSGAGRAQESFDAHLLERAVQMGVRHVSQRVSAVGLADGFPFLTTDQAGKRSYDFLVAAVGVNSALLKSLAKLPSYRPPPVTRAFLASREVKEVLPPHWQVPKNFCHCSPRRSVGSAAGPSGDRLVFIGDCGTTRLFKDCIGAAYRTAKAAARRYAPGQVICQQGEPAVCMYILHSGSIHLVPADDRGDHLVAELSAGDFSGETALLEHQRRTCTARVQRDSGVLTLERTSLLARTHADPSMPFRLIEHLVRRSGEHEGSLALLGPGSFFGEMTLFHGEIRSATARAGGDLRLHARAQRPVAAHPRGPLDGPAADPRARTTDGVARGGAGAPRAAVPGAGIHSNLKAEPTARRGRHHPPSSRHALTSRPGAPRGGGPALPGRCGSEPVS